MPSSVLGKAHRQFSAIQSDIPRKTTRAQRWIHAVSWSTRSLGHGTARQGRVAPQTQQAPRSSKRQNVNNQTTTTNPPSPAGFLPATSKAVPHNFLVLRHPLHRLKLYSLEQAPSSSTRCDVAGSDRALRGFVVSRDLIVHSSMALRHPTNTDHQQQRSSRRRRAGGIDGTFDGL